MASCGTSPATPRLPLAKGVEVLATHPSGVVALHKPAGVRSHPNSTRPDPRALLTVRFEEGAECFRWQEGDTAQAFHLLHRLDAPTSGLIAGCLEEALALRLREAFAQRQVEKRYYALVKGTPRGMRPLWRDRLESQRRGGQVRTACGGGEEAITQARVVKTSQLGPFAVTLLELKPQTGKPHQLRVQCAERRLPIVGDATYGDFRFNREFARQTGHKRLFLHSASLQLPLSSKGRGETFSAQCPLGPEWEGLV